MSGRDYFLNVLLALVLMAFGGQLQAQIVVITNSSNAIHGLGTAELKKIYFGKQKKFSNGNYIIPANQPADSLIRKQFSKKVLDMSVDMVNRYWTKRKYVRNVKKPQILQGDVAIKEWIKATPNSLGYIDSKSVDGSVKILLILP